MILAVIAIFINTDNSVILGTAALSANTGDNVFNSAALILSNTDLKVIILWAGIILISTFLAFLIGRFLDKRYGKYYCIDCVRKNTYIIVKSVK